MKSYSILWFVIIIVLVLPGCEVVAAIFKAGFWSAIVLIAIIAILFWWGISKYFGSKR